MTDLIQSMAASASGMTAQSARLRLSAENLANADTPGYRRKFVEFHARTPDAESSAAVAAGRVQLSRKELPKIHDPDHPLADAQGNYEGSNVDLMIEIADSREAQRSYEANLRLLDQARQMTRGLLDLLRR
ncbi:flagellar basal body rod protein FlgC [Albimonas sp. CAU 1670]|uniref:flagellar basal body rod protein FlgC n=1 Tax=Albimonas sp. CAU 1670 TaxID=3032599 RepID=UPI0023DCDE9E|nr:flagellar basal body rod protein FlgC [Albimonas sp. CAU 1670]MDF2233510.1 flagellar basal body rod protein FlgC [Albimonas sp. CAU 1670]